MNTCYCTRLAHPHEHSHLCEIYRLDRMIARRRLAYQFHDDFDLDEDFDYARQDYDARRGAIRRV